MLSHVLREIVLPPCSLFIVLLVGLRIREKYPRCSKVLIAGQLILFYILSIPLVSKFLANSTEVIPPVGLVQIREFKPDCIVVPGAGVNLRAPEFEGVTMPSSMSIGRLTYASYLSRELGLPVIVSGGYGERIAESEGATMARTLEDWGVEQVFAETQGKTTIENARLSYSVASGKGYSRIVLVTSAGHAARAGWSFRKAGFTVLLAPTGFRRPGPWEHGLLAVTPTHHHFSESVGAIRAHLAYLWYRIRYR